MSPHKTTKLFRCHQCENICENACDNCFNGNKFKPMVSLRPNVKEETAEVRVNAITFTK